MIFEHQDDLKERIESVAGRKVYGPVKVIEDTSDYMAIAGGMVIRLEGHDYFVRSDAKEGRFGIDEQPKFWVKHAIDLTDGTHKIIKLVFHEQFTTTIGPVKVRCVRSADKESDILAVTRGDLRFMQGITILDTKGNKVRVVEYIPGKSFFNSLHPIEECHEEYYHNTLPGILREILGCIDAIGFLHEKGQTHGDIRNDHIILESGTGRYRWIDFDYGVNYSDYDIWSMGNILNYAVGKGITTWKKAFQILQARGQEGASISPGDALLFYSYRLANLGLVFPHIDPELNHLLLRFSAGTQEYFKDLQELHDSLEAMLERM